MLAQNSVCDMQGEGLRVQFPKIYNSKYGSLEGKILSIDWFNAALRVLQNWMVIVLGSSCSSSQSSQLSSKTDTSRAPLLPQNRHMVMCIKQSVMFYKCDWHKTYNFINMMKQHWLCSLRLILNINFGKYNMMWSISLM